MENNFNNEIKTERLFYVYDYSSGGTRNAVPFEAEILEVRPFPGRENTSAVLLNKTIFYPEGGGQPSDRGTINGVEILDVTESGEILHLVLSGAPEIKPGRAELILDKSRRRDFSVCHTGQHLLSGILFHLMDIPTASVHLGDEVCFIDIKTAELKEEKIIELEERAADIIEENRPVIVHLCPPEDPASFPLRKNPPKGEDVIRILEIKDLDFSPCCGTHLKSTGEIGMMRILEAEKYKGMIRMSFIAGRRCLRDSRLLRKNEDIISRALSVPVKETGRGVLDYIEKTAVLETKFRELREESIRGKAETLAKKQSQKIRSSRAIVETYNLGMDDVINIGRTVQKISQEIFILTSMDENKFAACCGNKEIDLRILLRDMMIANNGKGGGSPSFFQGSFSDKKDLDAFISDLTAS